MGKCSGFLLFLQYTFEQQMRENIHNIINKTAELEEELRSMGLWHKNIPDWIKAIPHSEKKLIMPIAIQYFGDDVKKGKLLQLLIELDSLL